MSSDRRSFGNIAGCMVDRGLRSDASKPIRVLRDNVVIYEGELESLRRFKDDVTKCAQEPSAASASRTTTTLRSATQIECYERTEHARVL